MSTERGAAHNEALQRILQAHKIGATQLSLADLALEYLPNELGDLAALTTLRLDGCRELKDISALHHCTRLAVLDLRACPQVVDLIPLRVLQALRELRLGVRDWNDVSRFAESKSALDNIDVLADLTALTTLTLGRCDRVRGFQPLAGLRALQSLDLSGYDRLQDLQPLAGLTALQRLNLSRCAQLQDLQPLAGLTALQSLDLSGCAQLQDLQPLAGQRALQHLNLSGCAQLQDLQPLAGLMALQRLNLRWCKQLKDLQPLAGLTALQSLDLSECDQLQDLQPLAGLTALQSLDLMSCDRLQEVQPLAGLTALQSLDLSGCAQLQDLQPLAGLRALQSLDLMSCDRLQEVQPLAGLTALQSLDLSGAQLQDLQPLAGLMALQHLNLRWCKQLKELQPLAGLRALQSLYLSGCAQLQDLPPLAGLTALQSLDLSGCDQLQDLLPLAGLMALQRLNLRWCKQLQDLQSLAGLTALQSLDLSECDQLQDLQPLAKLAGLTMVNLFNGSLLDCSPTAQPLASWSKLAELFANGLIAAPSELGSSTFSDNALPRIRGWQEDLVAGEASSSRIKLFVLGNGQVGKTQICRRLRGEGFDSTIPSTHGISLGRVQLAAARGDMPAVDAHFWDFGGQDIYLGTHALFLDERAIYVIAWTPEHEKPKEFELNGVPMRDRPLAYWLEYVCSLAGPQPPVIVVQTQCDHERDVRSAPVPDNHRFERLRVTSSSAKEDDGMERLQLELKSAARYQLERYGKVRLPASWAAVGEELSARVAKKTLPRAHFDQLCRDKHASAVPGVVLEYLHRSGQVFWRDGLFGNQVILDQVWALDGVYAVLERNTALPAIRRQAGRFSPQLLAALVWRGYGEQEHKLFISLMKQCQICFKVTEDVYIAPALLPTQPEMERDMQHVWRGAAPDVVARLDYAFLHEGVLMAMLCGIGEKAGVHGVYWAYGVCFYDAEHKSTVRISSDLPDVAVGKAGGSIVVEAAGPGAAPLAKHLIESIHQLNIGRAPELTWELGQPGHEARAEFETARAHEQPFVAMSPAHPPRLPGEAQPVYVSYAWGEESDALVDEFERRLPDDFKLIRDKSAMRPGDWISRFMEDIGRAELVLVVLSEKCRRWCELA